MDLVVLVNLVTQEILSMHMKMFEVSAWGEGCTIADL